MRTGWLNRSGVYRVEHLPCPHPGVRIDPIATGVLHTIEGSLESGLNVFRQHYAPHFTVGLDRNHKKRIIQHVPLGYMASALDNDPGGVETNRLARVQIEVAAFSKTFPYHFDTATTDVLASLLATLSMLNVVPLRRNFPDKMPPLPWARESFSRRTVRYWNRLPGWYGHVEVPENDHWDPGALRWDFLLDRAMSKESNRTQNAKPKPRKLDVVRTMPIKRAAAKASPASCHA